MSWRPAIRRLLPLLPALLISSLAGVMPLAAQAPPQVPAGRFYGTVTIGGFIAPAGTSVVAQSAANGSLCGSGVVSGNAGAYFVDVQPFGGCSAGIVFIVNGQRADQAAQLSGTSSAAIPLNLTVSGPIPPPPFGTAVTYAAGWNLVAGPAGTVIRGAAGLLYSLQAGDIGYQTLSQGLPLRAGVGYWAFFPVSTAVALPASGFQSLTLAMPFGQLIMIGNPFTAAAAVSGAAAAYTYSASFGYQQTSLLQPGQGAWAIAYGGAIVLSAVAP